METDNINIGHTVIDIDGAICIITGKTSNSVEVYIDRKTEMGVNCKQWFTINDFNKRFKIVV